MTCLEVWLNGAYLGGHFSGYTPKILDIAPAPLKPLDSTGKKKDSLVMLGVSMRSFTSAGLVVQTCWPSLWMPPLLMVGGMMEVAFTAMFG